MKNPTKFPLLYLAIAAFMTVIFLVFQYKNENQANRSMGGISPAKKAEEKLTAKIDTIHFYLENSGSMDGYLNTGSEFKTVITEVLRNLELENEIKTYYINTKEYPTGKTLNQLLEKGLEVRDYQGSKYGDRGSSDITFMFEKAIENANRNGVGILVTDGIYSIGKVKDPEILRERLFQASKATRKGLIYAIKNNDIRTAIYKFKSNFSGEYYTSSGKVFVIENQQRPYYLFIFGNKQNVSKILKTSEVRKLSNFEEEANFFTIENSDLQYSILTTGPHKKGQFQRKPKQGFFTKEIINVKKTPKDKKIRLAIAVDFSILPLSEAYLLNETNYLVSGSNDSYKVVDVVAKDDFKSTTLTALKTQPKDFNPTHILVLESTGIPYGELKIELLNKEPEWISHSSTNDDAEYNQQTLGLDLLMNSFTEAYKKINKTDRYISFTIKIEP